MLNEFAMVKNTQKNVSAGVNRAETVLVEAGNRKCCFAAQILRFEAIFENFLKAEIFQSVCF